MFVFVPSLGHGLENFPSDRGRGSGARRSRWKMRGRLVASLASLVMVAKGTRSLEVCQLRTLMLSAHDLKINLIMLFSYFMK